MVTVDEVQAGAHRRSGRWAALRDKALTAVAKGWVAVAARVPDRFTWSQLVGGASASAGVFVLWGLGVGLLTTGLAVVLASWHLEGKH